MKLLNSFYFYLTLRIIGVICSIIVLFCIALTEGWPTRLPAVFGLVFSLLGLLFISCAIASMFIWDLSTMSLVKRSIFVWVFLLCSLVAGVMFVIAPSVCNYYNQFGCFEATYSPGFKVAAAFSFVNFVFGVFDVILNFVFLFRRGDSPRRPNSRREPTPLHVDPPSISIIDTTAEWVPTESFTFPSRIDPWAPRKVPSSTYV